VTFCSDFSGFEWRECTEKVRNFQTGQWQEVVTLFAEPPMGHLTSDAQQVIRPAECMRFFRHNNRGGLPRGVGEDLKPFAADILRGTTYKDKDGVNHSLYGDIFWDSTLPENIHVDRLDDANPLGGSLSLFMAVCPDFGKGLFEIMKDPPDQHAVLDESYWDKPWSRAKVGIRGPVVNWSGFWKDGQVLSSTDDQVNEYRLDMMRKIIDAIVAKEITKQWDAKPEVWGPAAPSIARSEGATKLEEYGKFETDRIIEMANSAIPDLNYSISRKDGIRMKFGMK
jgi:hypothetical protein